jgi:hypothetical protein
MSQTLVARLIKTRVGNFIFSLIAILALLFAFPFIKKVNKT